jgi:hypothetical protein
LRPRTPTRSTTRMNTPTNTPTNTPVPICGLAWRNVSSPGPASALYGIEVVSANDIWAVGINYTTSIARMLIEHWDGTQWRLVESESTGTSPNFLNAVAAASAKDVWATGYNYNGPLILRYSDPCALTDGAKR